MGERLPTNTPEEQLPRPVLIHSLYKLCINILHVVCLSVTLPTCLSVPPPCFFGLTLFLCIMIATSALPCHSTPSLRMGMENVLTIYPPHRRTPLSGHSF